MFRLFFILSIVFSLAFSSVNSERFQLLAQSIEYLDDKVIATGSVTIFSPSYYMTASKAIYDKNSNILELFDNVNIFHNNQFQSTGNYANFDVGIEKLSLSDIFLYEQNSKIWINSKGSTFSKDFQYLGSSKLSSCDISNPTWTIYFSGGNFNTKNKWLNIYNSRLYFKHIPIFYMPYLGFSLNKERRTGLLRPIVGIDSDEGFLYSQSIYIAPSKNWDLEITPQRRTNRGYGVYSNFRLVDTAYSKLDIKVGYFKESGDYQKDFNIKNDSHYGFNIDYKKEQIFTKKSNKSDGILLSINKLNDIDYINLEDYDDDYLEYQKDIESKLNYFYKDSKDYFGLYSRFYQNSQDSDDKTILQLLPELHYHKFLENILDDKVSYLLDINLQNHYREDGIGAKELNIYVPLTYSTYLLDDYLMFKFFESINFTAFDYSNSNIYSSGEYLQNITSFSISSDLVKEYKKYIHNITFSSSVIIPNNSYTNGNVYGITEDIDNDLGDSYQISAFPVTPPEKRVVFSVNQILYNKSLEKVLTSRLSQIASIESGDSFNDLENEVNLYFSKLKLSNSFKYSYDLDKVSNLSSSLSYNRKKYNISLTHYYNKSLDGVSEEFTTLNSNFKLNQNYNLSTEIDYDNIENISTRKEIGINMAKRCWDYNISYSDEKIPILTNQGAKTVENRVLYFELNLNPIIGLKQQYVLKEK